MAADAWAVIVAIAALVVSIVTAAFTIRQNARLSSSGYRAAEDLKAQLVALAASLRSLIFKGTNASQDGQARDLSGELEAIRHFQTSAGGYVLMALAARYGASEHAAAGNWRTLGLQLAELTGLNAVDQSTSDNAIKARAAATEIELTLSALTASDIEWMVDQITNLPALVLSLSRTRALDMVLRIWFDVGGTADPLDSLDDLRALQAAGIRDPDVDEWVAVLTDDARLLQAALGAGADPGVTLGTVLERHAGAAAAQ